jgi:hypothetical protein
VRKVAEAAGKGPTSISLDTDAAFVGRPRTEENHWCRTAMTENANDDLQHVVQQTAPGGDNVDPVSDDADSAYGDIASETASLTSSIMKGRFENGRRYHAYQDGIYMFPDDEQEQDRLDIKYASLQNVFNDKIVFAPLDEPQQILDIGTGTGIWAIDAGELFPGATGTFTELIPLVGDD